MATSQNQKPAGDAATNRDAPTYENIVVALDGSKEAEAILPHVEAIARAFNSKVTFVCALPAVEGTLAGDVAISGSAIGGGSAGSIYDTRDELGQDDASYLASTKAQWIARGFDAHCEEPQMRPAEAVVQIAKERNADLIAIATHARSGISRAMHGSITDQIVHTAPCAVLVLKLE
jgi:nucleotide-binding universal stress UspA family protein